MPYATAVRENAVRTAREMIMALELRECILAAMNVFTIVLFVSVMIVPFERVMNGMRQLRNQ